MTEKYKNNKSREELIEEIKILNEKIIQIEQSTTNNNPYDHPGRILLDAISEDVILQTHDGIVLDLNITAAKRLGKSREELIGSKIIDTFDKETTAKRRSKMMESIINKQAVQFQDERNGIYYENTIYPIIENDQTTKLIVFAKDITEKVKAIEIIRESEERYKELVEFSPYAIFIFINERIVYSNDAGLKLLGFTKKEELLGKNLHEFLHTDYQEIVAQRNDKIIKGIKNIPPIEIKLISKTGKILDVESIGLPFKYKGETAIQVILKDITDRKQAEEQLRENQRMLFTLITNLPGIVYRCKNDKKRTMEFISDGCKNLTGYPSSDLIFNEKISYADIIHPEHRQGVWDTVQKAIEERKPFELNYKIITCNHEERWVWEKGQGVFDEKGDITALEGFITDITEMKTSEEAVRKLTRAVEQSPATIVITDLKGNIEYINPKFTKLTGYLKEEVIGQNPRVLKSGKNPPEMYEELWKTITSGNEWHGEFNNKRKDGTYFWESASISPIKDEDGSITHFLGIKEDITEQKIKDEKFQNSLKEKEVMLREIHHRVKNNLQIISSLLKLQASYITDPQSLEYFRISQERVKSMALVHQQLYRSTDLSSIDFGDYLRNLTTHLFQAYGVSESNIQLNIEANKIFLGIDSAIPCGLLVNEIISNSLKHAFLKNQRGKINIKMQSNNDNTCLLTISDNGIGFPENIDFRNTKSLGMQLVITLTEQLDGKIELVRGGGTTFNITFKSLNYKKRV